MIQRSKTTVETGEPSALRPVTNRMNSFQQLMQRWSTLHPYNVVDIARLSGSFDPQRLQKAAESVLEEWGIGRLELDPDERRFTYHSGPAHVDVQPLAVSVETTSSDLARHATTELNRPFPKNGQFPIRMAGANVGNEQYITWTYQHWPLDGSAGKNLFLTIMRRYLGLRASSVLCLSGRQLPSMRQAFWRHTGFRHWLKFARETYQSLRALRHCHAPLCGERTDLTVEVDAPEIPADALCRLQHEGRRHGVTVNDVLVAGLVAAIFAEIPASLQQTRRRNLAISNIANLRTLAPEQLNHVTGLYLGCFDVFAGASDCTSFEGLVKSISRQTGRVKRGHLYLRCLGELAYSNRVWPWFSPAERVRHLMNNHPVAAGVSNLRLDDKLFDNGLAEVCQQVTRAVPTGMMTPMALGVTTALGRLSMTFTSRTTGYPRGQRQAIIARYVDWLESLPSARS